MDRRRPGSPNLVKQWTSEAAAMAPSPRYHHGRSASAFGYSTIKRNQNFAAKAAAQRLAQVMASQTDDDDDDDNDDDLVAFADAMSNPRNARPSIFTRNDVVPRSHSPAFFKNVVEESAASQQPQSLARMRSASPPLLRPPVIAPPVRTVSSILHVSPPMDPPAFRQQEKRFPLVGGLSNAKVPGDNQVTSALQDELQTLQEKNENMLEKHRIEEERRQEAEARIKELEKQVASLSEGVSLEAKLLSRKEAMLRQQEEALRNAKQSNTNWVDDEVASLRSKVKDLKDVKAAAIDQLQGVENEVKALRPLTSRMALTQKEMEEVVLKRCWLARYWGLAVKYGISEDAAVSKHEHWSSLAPLPFEIVLSAGQKAKMEADSDNSDKSQLSHDSSDISGEGTVESMLSVEMGLQELSSLKVEDAIVRALSEQRRLNTVRSSQTETNTPGPGNQKSNQAIELGAEEAEDILFKEAWLTYFWRRALTVGIEEHIAAERLKFWKERSAHAPTSHDAAAVEQCLVELRKLGIERRIWTAPRKGSGTFETPA